MTNTNHRFNNTQYDLGVADGTGDTKDQVDSILRRSAMPTTHICIICTNTAKYKLVPKHSHLNSIEIQDRGYVCAYCLEQKYINPDQFGIRELK